MVFSGAVFLYAFLPLTLAVYALAPQRGRNAVLLIASLLFYAFGEPVYVLLLLLSSVSNWALSLCIERRGAFRGNIPPDRLLPADKSVPLPCNGFPVEGN